METMIGSRIDYVPIVLRIPRNELEKLDAVCKELNLNRTQGLRTSYRFLMYNPDLVRGIVKLDSNPDMSPIIEKVSALSQGMADIKEGITNLAEGNRITPFKVKERIGELILKILRENKGKDTTRDKLRDKIRRQDPSLEGFMFPSASNAFPVYEQVLMELQENGELTVSLNGIISKGDD